MRKLLLLFGIVLLAVSAGLYWSCNVAEAPMAMQAETVTADESQKQEIRPAFAYWKEMMEDPETGRVNIADRAKEMKQFNELRANKTSALDAPIVWEELGPNNVGGRTRALVISSGNDQELYAGGVTGGVFKSTDGASSWNYLKGSSDAGCITVSSMLESQDGNSVFVGTGNTGEVLVGIGVGYCAPLSYPTCGIPFFPGSGIYKLNKATENFEQLTHISTANVLLDFSSNNSVAIQNLITEADCGGEDEFTIQWYEDGEMDVRGNIKPSVGSEISVNDPLLVTTEEIAEMSGVVYVKIMDCTGAYPIYFPSPVQPDDYNVPAGCEGDVNEDVDGLEEFGSEGLDMVQSPFLAVNRLAYTNSTLFAATANGLYFSQDEGVTWDVTTDEDGFIVSGLTGGFVEDALDGYPYRYGNNVAYDVQVSGDGTVYATVGTGLFKSVNGNPTGFVRIDSGDDVDYDGNENDSDCNLINGADDGVLDFGKFPLDVTVTRKDITVSKSDPNYVYVVGVDDEGTLAGVWQSKNAGSTFELIGQRTPQFNPPRTQGTYDLCIAVDPNNPERIFMGGVELWQWSATEGWVQVDYYCSNILDNPQDGSCVHPDKQGLFYHPTNSDILYCTHDGGISVTYNATEQYPDFKAVNSGYNVLQCHGVGGGQDGKMMVGAQDNGTHFLGFDLNSTQAGIEVWGGDGGHTDVSNISDKALFGATQSSIIRSVNGGETFSCMLTVGSSGNPFNRLYTSGAAGAPCAVEGGDYFNHPFLFWEDSELYYKIKSWQRDPNSEIVNGIVGEIEHNGQKFIVTTDPDLYKIEAENVYTDSIIYLGYELETQSIIDNPNDDKFKRTKYFTGSASYHLWLTMDGPKPGKDPEWVDLSNKCVSGKGSCEYNGADGTDNYTYETSLVSSNDGIVSLSISSDGDMVVAGTRKGKLYRVSNLNAAAGNLILTDESERSVYVDTKVMSGLPFNGQRVTGISVNPLNKDHVVISTGTYGSESYIFETFNFTDENPEFESIQGNLPLGIIYSCLVLRGGGEDGTTDIGDIKGNVLIGTSYGVYYGERSGNSFNWEYQGNEMGKVPVIALKEEPLARINANEYKNSYVVYAGTYGRGMFRTLSTNLTGIPADVTTIPDFTVNTNVGIETLEVVSDVKVYPNPMVSQATIELSLSETSDVRVNIYDLQGRLMVEKVNEKLTTGKHQFTVNQSELNAGTYVVTVETAQQKLARKLMVSE